MGIQVSDYWAYKCRTIGHTSVGLLGIQVSDYWAVRLLGCRTIRMSDYWQQENLQQINVSQFYVTNPCCLKADISYMERSLTWWSNGLITRGAQDTWDRAQMVATHVYQMLIAHVPPPEHPWWQVIIRFYKKYHKDSLSCESMVHVMILIYSHFISYIFVSPHTQ